METTMRMPGFSAAGSLYTRSRNYRPTRAHSAAAAAGEVSPQLPKSIGFCMAECDDQYEWGTLDHSQCEFGCLDSPTDTGGGGGGIGGGGGSDGSCGPCIKSGPLKGKKHCVIPGKGGYYAKC